MEREGKEKGLSKSTGSGKGIGEGNACLCLEEFEMRSIHGRKK